MCASVVLNRVLDDSGDFPDDLLGVIYQENQFGPADTQDLKIKHDEVTQECYGAAENILTYGSVLPKEIMVFYGENDKGWVLTRKVYEKHSRTVFAYLRE
jgi:spore germination cell wall hydrolase CwlJ-like protein